MLLTLGLVAAGEESMSGCSASGTGHVTIRKQDCESDVEHLSSSGAAIGERFANGLQALLGCTSEWCLLCFLGRFYFNCAVNNYVGTFE